MNLWARIGLLSSFSEFYPCIPVNLPQHRSLLCSAVRISVTLHEDQADIHNLGPSGHGKSLLARKCKFCLLDDRCFTQVCSWGSA